VLVEYNRLVDVPIKLYRAFEAHGTVIAVHGFGGSKESAAIEGLAARVCNNGLNVLTFDLPAHGERTEPCEELTASRCIRELLAVENYAKTLGGELYAFATSFGGMCMLQRIDKLADSYRRIVFRVPAVNMAESLIKLTEMTTGHFDMVYAIEHGFRVKLGREYIIPCRYYENLRMMHCRRTSEAWNSDRLLTIYAENDEIVDPADTRDMLRANPEMRWHCISGSGHRMSEPHQLAEALDLAADFLLHG